MGYFGDLCAKSWEVKFARKRQSADCLFYCRDACKNYNEEYNGSRKRGEMLDIFITSRVRRKIVVVFAKYPDFKTHVRALSKLIKEDPGNIQRELQRLERGGFLLVSQKGNTKIYQMNKQFPLLKELQSMVIKSQQMSKNKTDKSLG